MKKTITQPTCSQNKVNLCSCNNLQIGLLDKPSRMNNDPVDIAKDTGRVSESRGAVARENPSNNELPTLERLDGTPPSYSDAASNSSENSISSRRQHQRGGRRRKQKGVGQQLFSESECPKPSLSQYEETQGDIESTDSVPYPENGDEEELQKARSSPAPEADREQSPPKKYQADTGIRAFNIKKAKSSGGRPVGITIERPKSSGKSSGKAKGKKKGKEKPGKEKSGKKSDGAVEGNLQEEWEESNEEEEEDGEAETETETRNPVSIRLDLDLEVEIFLRAKIKGAVTITFL